jgi:tetratricopeptide (TPR) repeat protein
MKILNNVAGFFAVILLVVLVCLPVSAYNDQAVEYYNQGVDYGNQGKWSEAVASYDKALAINPKLADAWNNRGVALGNLGRYTEEVASYDKALLINPNFAIAQENRKIALDNQAQKSPLLFAPIGAIIVTAGILLWSRYCRSQL